MSQVGTRIRACMAAFVVACVLISPAGALAGTAKPPPGVHVDPGSPTAKEYAIPLGTARGNGKATTGGPEPLFGSGITKATAPSTTASTSTITAPTPTTATTTTTDPSSTHPPVTRTRRLRRPAHRHHAHRSAGGVAGGGPARPPGPPSPQSVIGTRGSSGIGITWMLGAGILVLLLGGIGGAALSRRARGANPDPFPG